MLNAKQVARLDVLLLNSETDKKQVRDFVTGLLKSGSITEGDATEVRRILSDKDMEAEDALDEIRTIHNIQLDSAKNAENADSKTDEPVGDTGSSQVLADEIGSEDPTDEEIAESNAPSSLLAGLVSQITDPVVAPSAPVAPKTTPEKTGKTIEANRVEQNGLKRPSTGSTCALIWAACDRITSEKGSTCTSGELFAACNGLNECTLRTQYARWRQFNGVTGRLPGQTKSQKVPAEFTEVLEQLAARLSSDDAKASLELVKNSDELVTWLAANFINF